MANGDAYLLVAHAAGLMLAAAEAALHGAFALRDKHIRPAASAARRRRPRATMKLAM